MNYQIFRRLSAPVAALALAASIVVPVWADGEISTISTLGDPSHAALLNAGTAMTALGPDGRIGAGIRSVALTTPGNGYGDEVAGVQVGTAGGELNAQSVSTLGEPSFAALLNAGTVYTGLNANGAVGEGITAFAG